MIWFCHLFTPIQCSLGWQWDILQVSLLSYSSLSLCSHCKGVFFTRLLDNVSFSLFPHRWCDSEDVCDEQFMADVTSVWLDNLCRLQRKSLREPTMNETIFNRHYLSRHRTGLLKYCYCWTKLTYFEGAPSTAWWAYQRMHGKSNGPRRLVQAYTLFSGSRTPCRIS